MAKPRNESNADPSDTDRGLSSSLTSGLAILGCFSGYHPVLRLTDIAETTGLNRSTTHRYASTLVALGYLTQDSDRRYRLGLRVIDIALSALNQTNLPAIARPQQEHLRNTTRLATGLAVLDGPDIVYLEVLGGYIGVEDSPRKTLPWIGSRLPAHRTAAGRLLISYLPDAAQAMIIDQIDFGWHGRAANNARTHLLDDLTDIACKSVAISDKDPPEAIVIAVPIHDGTGQPIAALTLLGSSAQASASDLQADHEKTLGQAARRISAQLGYPQAR